MRGDRGTENKHVAQMHNMLTGTESFIFGPSTANQRIESLWRHLRMECCQFWIDLLGNLKDTGYFDGSVIDKNLIQYVFMPILQVIKFNISVHNTCSCVLLPFHKTGWPPRNATIKNVNIMHNHWLTTPYLLHFNLSLWNTCSTSSGLGVKMSLFYFLCNIWWWFGDHLISKSHEIEWDANSPDLNSQISIFGFVWKIMPMRTIPRQFLNWKGQLWLRLQQYQ